MLQRKHTTTRGGYAFLLNATNQNTILNTWMTQSKTLKSQTWTRIDFHTNMNTSTPEYCETSYNINDSTYAREWIEFAYLPDFDPSTLSTELGEALLPEPEPDFS